MTHPRMAFAGRRTEPDAHGRDLVYLEVDLGHYSRQRVLGKLRAFLAAPDARSIVFACPTRERAREIAAWIRAEHGEAVMDRVQPLTLDRIAAGPACLDPGTEPAGPRGPQGAP